METVIERRFIEAGDDGLGVDVRASGSPVFKGYAARYNSQSLDLGGFREVLLPGCFDKILNRTYKRVDVPLLFNHNPDHLLARTANESLRLTSDEKGLKFEADAPDTQLGRDLQTLIRSGTVSGCSFAFTVDTSGESWGHDDKGNAIRTIRECTGLYDTSIVTSPAYPSTSVAIRSLEAWKAAGRQLEERAAGGLLLSIDYDQTWTAAPAMWRSFVEDAVGRGNRVAMITRREDTTANQDEIRSSLGDSFSALEQLVLCGPDVQKRAAAEAAGLSVDIWIDDTPETIVAAPAVRQLDRLSCARAAAAAAVARMSAHVRPV